MQSHEFFLNKIALGQALDESETASLFDCFFSETNEISDQQITDYLTHTAHSEISSAALIGAARSLRKHMIKVAVDDALKDKILDTCGTGGSGLDAFNTSTVAAFVLAAAGQPVAKHGNRAATSKCGSADLLATLGVNVDLTTDALSKCLAETNFCFMFAPQHHPATKRVQLIRKQLALRTIFNFLGPLANPAGASLQVLGVSSLNMLEPMALALAGLRTKRALVVCGEDGLDEITLTGPTHVYEISSGDITSYTIKPTDYGLALRQPEEIRGFHALESAAMARKILAGEKNALRDIVVFNAAAAFYIADLCNSIAEGVARAEAIIDSGAAARSLQRIIDVTQRLAAN